MYVKITCSLIYKEVKRILRVGYIKGMSTETISEEFKELEKYKVDKIITALSTNSSNDIKEVTNTLQKGDVLFVQYLEYLGPTLNDIIDTLYYLEKKDVGIFVAEIQPQQLDITDTSVQKLLRTQLISILKWVTNREKREIRNRQALGMEAARNKRGQGRPKKYSPYAENKEDREAYFTVVTLLENEIPIKRISEITGLSRNTIYTIVNDLKKK